MRGLPARWRTKPTTSINRRQTLFLKHDAGVAILDGIRHTTSKRRITARGIYTRIRTHSMVNKSKQVVNFSTEGSNGQQGRMDDA
jgi:hypothetical protein